jgi:hypothetical protein
MRSNVKLAWIISGLVLGTGLLFACPTPVPKLAPNLLPVNQSSTVTYVQNDDNYNAPATDGDTYAAINHNPIAITVDRPDGYTISGDGVTTRTINWNKPGVYNVTVSVTAFWWNVEKSEYYSNVGTTTFQVTVVDVKRVEFQWGNQPWTDITSQPVNYVPVGSNINFRSISDPDDADWPDGKPVWTGAAAGGADPSQANNTFTTPGTAGLSAECGNTVQGQICAIDVVLTTPKNTGLWWFNGEQPSHYDVSGMLTARGVSSGIFKWDVVAGIGTVKLNNGGADADSIAATGLNTVAIKSASASAFRDDVAVQLTYNGVAICQITLDVSTPKEEIPAELSGSSIQDDPWVYQGNIGYMSIHNYDVVDQFDGTIQWPIEMNEKWTQTAQINYPAGTTWPQVAEGAWITASTGNGADTLAQVHGSPLDVPNTEPPQTPLHNIPVYNWIGEHWAGSLTKGKGVKVLTKKWQYYTDHARRE